MCVSACGTSELERVPPPAITFAESSPALSLISPPDFYIIHRSMSDSEDSKVLGKRSRNGGEQPSESPADPDVKPEGAMDEDSDEDVGPMPMPVGQGNGTVKKKRKGAQHANPYRMKLLTDVRAQYFLMRSCI